MLRGWLRVCTLVMTQTAILAAFEDERAHSWRYVLQWLWFRLVMVLCCFNDDDTKQES